MIPGSFFHWSYSFLPPTTPYIFTRLSIVWAGVLLLENTITTIGVLGGMLWIPTAFLYYSVFLTLLRVGGHNMPPPHSYKSVRNKNLDLGFRFEYPWDLVLTSSRFFRFSHHPPYQWVSLFFVLKIVIILKSRSRNSQIWQFCRFYKESSKVE